MSKKGNEVRCIHRHTINEHPKCFQKGLVRGVVAQPLVEVPVTKVVEVDYKQSTVKTVVDKNTPWYQQDGTRICYFDIETDNLTADFGTMLSWVVKEKGGKYTYDVITKQELFDCKFDERIVKSLIDTLSQYDVVMGYYSTGFDMPFVRAKALHYGLDFPGYGELYHWDLYYTVKSKLKISRKSLDNACDYLGIKGKTPIDKDFWRKGKYGDEESLKYILEHNIADCDILEKLHEKLEFTRKWIKTSL